MDSFSGFKNDLMIGIVGNGLHTCGGVFFFSSFLSYTWNIHRSENMTASINELF